MVTVEEINKKWLPKLEQSFGVKVTEVGEGLMKARYTVNEMMLQPFGILHGSIHCLIAESIGSMAGMIMAKEGFTVVGQSMHAMYFRPAKLGTEIDVEAKAQHRGSRSQVWDIQMTDKGTGKSLARCTLSLAVVDMESLKKS